MDPDAEALEVLWRFRLRAQSRADGRAAHEPKPLPPRCTFWREFLTEPQPVSNTLPNFLLDAPEG